MAGEWFAGRSLIEEALDHFICAGYLDRAAELVLSNLDASIDQDFSCRSLAALLAKFTPEAVVSRPALLVAQGHVKRVRHDIAGLKQLLDNASSLLHQNLLADRNRNLFNNHVDTLRAFCLYWEGDAAGSLDHALRALADRDARGSVIHIFALTYAAASLAATGKRDEAMLLLNRAISEDNSEGRRHGYTLRSSMELILLMSGDLSSAREVAEEILASDAGEGISGTAIAQAHYCLGCTEYERNNIEMAQEHFSRVVYMRYMIPNRFYQDALFGLTLAAILLGRPEEAGENAAKARIFAYAVGSSSALRLATSFEVRLALISGTWKDAATIEYAPADPRFFWMENPALTWMEFFLTEHPDKGLQLSDSIAAALQQAMSQGNLRQAAQFRTIRAMSLALAGWRREAMETLRDTLYDTKHLGYVRSFLDRGPVIIDLLHDLNRENPEDEHILTILKQHTIQPPGPPTPANETPSWINRAPSPDLELSSREIEVLEMLEKRLVNKEIADRLGVSSETIKSHAASIYRKLYASGRRHAVENARKRGLLPIR